MTKSISIPNTMFNINENNNSLIFNPNAAGDIGLQLPVGQYNFDDFQTALQTEFSNVGQTVTITSDPLTKKLTLTFSVPTVLYGLEQSSLAPVIGYEITTDNLTVHNIPGLVDLGGLKKVYIKSNVLSDSVALSSSSKKHVNVFTEIDIDVAFGFIAHRVLNNLETSDEITFSNPKNISSIDIELLDQNLQPVDLNKHDFHIILKVME
jgi:hypothetical protein